jgi:small subunit ribosomal protein S18
MARREKKERSGRKRSRRDEGPRKRSRYLESVTSIDVNDSEFMRQFVTEHGKMIPSRLSGATAKQQRQIRRGIRRARSMGLIM